MPTGGSGTEAHLGVALQLADYGLWAVMRRYNFQDAQAEDAIRHNIRHVYDLFSAGHKHYYGPLA